MKEIEVQEGQLRQIFASVVWTHKIQEKQADLYKKKYKLIETIKIISATLTSSGIFSVLFVNGYWLKVVSAVLSAFSLFVTIYCETYDLKMDASIHKKSALELMKLREKIISILSAIKCDKLLYDELIAEKEEIYKRYFEICEETTDAEDKAVNLASANLKIRKDNTYSDEEIDSFLPVALRKINLED